jgi:hypothetical protein
MPWKLGRSSNLSCPPPVAVDARQVSSQHALASLLIRLRRLPQAQALLARCLERLQARGGAEGGAEGAALEAET